MRALATYSFAFMVLASVSGTPLAAQNATDGYLRARDGQRLHYTIEGRGVDTILFVHGGPGVSSGAERPDLAALSAKHVVIYYDQRGGGLSAPLLDPESPTIANHISDVESIRRGLHLRRPTLMAHSFGTIIAALYAALYSDSIKALVLVDPAPPNSSFDTTYLRSRSARLSSAARLRADALMDSMSSGTGASEACRSYFRIMSAANYFDSTAASRSRANPCEGGDSVVATLMTRSRITFNSLRPEGKYELAAMLARLTTPTLIVYGTADPIPIQAARQWASDIHGSCLVVVARAGHYPYIERPDAFFPLVSEFILNSRGKYECPKSRL